MKNAAGLSAFVGIRECIMCKDHSGLYTVYKLRAELQTTRMYVSEIRLIDLLQRASAEARTVKCAFYVRFLRIELLQNSSVISEEDAFGKIKLTFN